MNADGRRWVWRVVLFALLLAVAALACADGKYFGAKALDPTTPFQRGLVAFDGSIETLVVESTLKAPSGDYVWVIPIPANAISIEPVTPGTLETAVSLLTPPVERSPSDLFVLSALVWLSALFALFRAARRRSSAGAFIGELLLLLFGLALAGIFFFPVFAGPSGSRMLNPRGDFGHIGSYEIAEVSHRDAELAVKSLREMGVDLSSKGKHAVSVYVQEGWKFVVAKLVKQNDKLAAPHPLKLRFPTNKAVYPMRLTRLQNEPLTLQLVVIGSTTASASPLRLWRSTRFVERPSRRQIDGFEIPSEVLKPVGHPEISALAKSGDAVSYLTGEVSPVEMTNDIVICWDRFREHKLQLRTWPGAFWSGANWLLLSWSLFMTIGAAWGLHRSLGESWIHRWAIGFGFMLALTLGYSEASSGTKVEAQRFSRMAHVSGIRTSISRIASFEWGKGGEPKKQFEEILMDYSKRIPPNRDIPGGVTVTPQGQNWLVTVYDEDGVAWKKLFKPRDPTHGP
jgi:hypothetical protein